jgi:hypothetical protein
MPQSRTDLILRALEENGVPGAGQSPSAEDMAVVRNRIDVLFKELAARDVFPADEYGDDDIPDAAFEPLALILASRTARPFGGARDVGVERLAEKALRRVGRQYTIPTMTTDIMRAVRPTSDTGVLEE